MMNKTHYDPFSEDHTIRYPFVSGILVVLVAILSAFLIGAIHSLPQVSPDIRAQALAHMEASGVENPVTAVLLNFRAYDTLLEIGVLLLAAVGSWSFGNTSFSDLNRKMSPVLSAMVRLLIPVMILISGYTLWIGKHAPGGAFQAGAILGAAGVFWLATGPLDGKAAAIWVIRLLLVAGFAVFIGIAIAVMATEANFIQYPKNWAGGLILCIEAAAAVSIGVTLAALFLGGYPRR